MGNEKNNLPYVYGRLLNAWERYALQTHKMTASLPFPPSVGAGPLRSSAYQLQTRHFEQMLEGFRTSLMISLMNDGNAINEVNGNAGVFGEKISTLDSDNVGRLLGEAMRRLKTAKSE